jgi:hypothetical protein
MLGFDCTSQRSTAARGSSQARIRTTSGRMVTPAMGTRLHCGPAQYASLDKRVGRTVVSTATPKTTEAVVTRMARKLWNRLVHRHSALCRCGCGRTAAPMTDLSGQPMLFLLAKPCADRLFPGTNGDAYLSLRTLCG